VLQSLIAGDGEKERLKAEHAIKHHLNNLGGGARLHGPPTACGAQIAQQGG